MQAYTKIMNAHTGSKRKTVKLTELQPWPPKAFSVLEYQAVNLTVNKATLKSFLFASHTVPKDCSHSYVYDS